ncbi:DUF2892 domain-containing protein [Synechococcus sp. C9]|jgi:hypothetical protein|uniref:YgaP family membrane protein n=1 Tax=Synechococcus sp. C9 TaxID=102119 RepID=UPI001FF1AC59|nr:DUF2892 domain-containing protein [Synechococcus sp. C9]
MASNLGWLDRLIRLVLAALLFYLGWFVFKGSGWGLGLMVVAGILFITGLVGFCGLYQLLGISSRPSRQAP